MPASSPTARRSASRIVVSLFTIVVLISAAVAPFAALGTVGTDQSDYAPGSVVTISGDNSNGAGYLPGETVVVQVSGPNSYQASCAGTAGPDGAWSCQVTLWNSSLAVGSYTYVATGQTSGVTETGSFTDGVVRIVGAGTPAGSFTFNVQVTGFSDTGCTSNAGTLATLQFSTTQSAVGNSVKDANHNNPNSLLLHVAGLSSDGRTFLSWDSSPTSADICASVPSTGNSDHTAHFGAPPPSDTTAPSIAYSQSPNGTNGWFKTAPASVSVAATDPDDNVSAITCTLDGSPASLSGTSGIGTSHTASGVVSTSTDGDHTVSCTATDTHSNTTSPAATTHLKLDKTAPTIAFDHQNPAANGNGWNNSDVTDYWNCADALSGPVSASVNQTLSSEGANQSLTGTCTDNAGNTASDTQTGINLDKTAPTVNPASVSDSTWRNTDLSQAFTASDALSGLAHLADASFTVTASAESASGSDPTVASHTVCDQAGNCTTRSVSALIDLHAPVIVDQDATAPPDGTNGWYVTPVSNHFTASDALSGLANPSQADFTVSSGLAEGSAVTINSGAVGDQAGNTNPGINSAAFKIDLTAPTITFDSRTPPNGNGWNNGDVTVTWTCSDTGSGVVNATVSVTVSSEGANQSATGTCTDEAGNTASDTQIGISIDKTAPTIAFDHQSPAANGNGWNNSDVTDYWNCADALSGPVSASVNQTLSSEGANQSLTGTCTDNAGNTASDTQTGINLDKTAPTIPTFVGGGLTDGGMYYFGFVPSGPTGCTSSDALSGLASCAVAGYGSGTGAHTITASALDKAGNSSQTLLHYTVLSWTLHGFYAPVDGTGSAYPNIVWNTVKNGSTVPLKFQVFAGTTELTSTSYMSSFTAATIVCDGTGTDAPVEFITTGGTSLRYDSTGHQFIQNWQTPKTPGRCYVVTMTTQDGSSLVAHFRLK